MTGATAVLLVREQRWRVAFWLAVVAGIVSGPVAQPVPDEPWFPGADKVEHALSFAVAGVDRRARWLSKSRWRWRSACLLLGGAIELAQGSFTTTRSAEWLDWLADAAGIALGWATVGSLRRRTHRRASIGLEQEHGR